MKTNETTIPTLETIDADALEAATGGYNPKEAIKNSWKTAANAAVNYENAVLPDQVGPGFASWNVPKIPKPFKDDPFSKYRKELKSLL